MSKTTELHIGLMIIDHWTIPDRITDDVLMSNRSQFNGKFFN